MTDDTEGFAMYEEWPTDSARDRAVREAPSSVHDLRTATKAYWGARTVREDQAAYHEMLLFGGEDGWRDRCWRTTLARWLRKVALLVEPRA